MSVKRSGSPMAVVGALQAVEGQVGALGGGALRILEHGHCPGRFRSE